MPYGAVYIRSNVWWHRMDIVKVGIAKSIKDRDSTYITSEPIAGKYLLVFEVDIDDLCFVDKQIKIEFQSLNTYHQGGGTEFYDRSITYRIEPFLKSIGIYYKRLTETEINQIQRSGRRKIVKQDIEYRKVVKNNRLIQKIFNMLSKKAHIIPRPHQQETLEKATDYFKSNSIGKIILPCGVGKTFLSLFIIRELNADLILYGIPNNYLQLQTRDEILKLFPKASIILFGGNGTTDIDVLKREIILNKGYQTFVISTYASCDKIVILRDYDISFDIKIGDEAHHLAGPDTDKGYREYHKILSNKTLFLTATEKLVKTNKDDLQMYSMEDDDVFGKCIDSKTTYWAIENKLITDYKIIVTAIKTAELIAMINILHVDIDNYELFVSAYICLKSFEKMQGRLSHILIYTNTTENADKVARCIDQILDLGILGIRKEDVYNKAIHNKSCKNMQDELELFGSKPYGIISCVYIFGEGFDYPKLNGVCVAENMQSDNRITQALLRANRLYSPDPNKTAYYILPYIDNNDWDNADKSFYKVRQIIKHLGNSDENINHKITFCECVPSKPAGGDRIHCSLYDAMMLEENPDMLYELKTKLKHYRDLKTDLSEEQEEYNHIRIVNQRLCLKSKLDYKNTSEKHRYYIENPQEYFTRKGVWTDWYDFLGVDTSGFIQTKEAWVHFCKAKNIRSLEDYEIYSDLYSQLPKEPAEFYKQFSNIPFELGFAIARRRA